MLMAIIIYNLQRREHRLEEIVEKLEGIETEPEIEKTVKWMEQRGQLVKIGEVYRIAPNLNNIKNDTQKSLIENQERTAKVTRKLKRISYSNFYLGWFLFVGVFWESWWVPR